MQLNRDGSVAGYVKVEVRSRSPKLWGWCLHQDGIDRAVEQSDELFRHAEDAWKAGQAALDRFKPPTRRAA